MLLDTVRMSAPGLSGSSDEATCIKEEFLTAPAAVDVRLIAVQFAHNLRYGYVKGAEEDVAEALARCNVLCEMLSDDDLCFRDLSQLDAIVIGPNAYLMRRELQNNAWRFLEYVERGGTLIVQYQGYGYQAAGLAPYPFRYHQPHDRVTQEQAPVTILDPAHLVFRQPNAVAEEDFAGWVHDRDMYFFGDWDRRYQPLLACNDPGEEPRRGGFLAASYGRGTYLYTAYSLYRQLSAGVPGTFRLFANLLGMPAARTLARAALLRNVSLFSSLTEDQREAVARIMTEQRVDDGIYLCHEHDKGDFIAVFNESVASLTAMGINPQVGPLADDYLPLYYSCDADGKRLRLRHLLVGTDHFAITRCACGADYSFPLGGSTLSVAALAQTQRWSPDVSVTLLQNDLLVGLPDTEIGAHLAQRAPIVQLLRETRPRVVLAPHWDDRHPDHTAGGKLVREACYLAGLGCGDERPHRPERLYFYMLHTPFEASFVVDVSAVWERRMAAVLAYRSQFQAGAGLSTALRRPAFLRFVEARAICFGAMIGAACGEAFFCPGAVPVTEVPGLSSPPPPDGELPPYSMY